MSVKSNEATIKTAGTPHDCDETQVTSDWTSSKLTSFTLTPEVIWTNDPTKTYVKLTGSYGWVIGGKTTAYPFRWDIEGDSKGFEIESGYKWDVGGLFTFIPCIGFQYNIYDTTIKHQKLFHSTIGSFVSQNGNKTKTRLYFPYIGFELDFKTKLFKKYDVQCALSYNFGYGGGQGKTTVRHTVITDLPDTSRFGSHLKYRDLIMQDFEFAIAYSPAKKWTIAIEGEFNIYYNTCKLPLKLDHNRAFAKAGQFTRSQYHVVSDTVTSTYSVIVAIVYSLSGEGTFIAH